MVRFKLYPGLVRKSTPVSCRTLVSYRTVITNFVHSLRLPTEPSWPKTRATPPAKGENGHISQNIATIFNPPNLYTSSVTKLLKRYITVTLGNAAI